MLAQMGSSALAFLLGECIVARVNPDARRSTVPIRHDLIAMIGVAETRLEESPEVPMFPTFEHEE